MRQENQQYTDAITVENQGLSTKTIAFLEQRKLEEDLALRLGLRSYVNESGSEYVVFSYGSTHEKYRNIEDKGDCFIKGGAGLPLFNAAIAEDKTTGQPLLITEGELDAITAIQSGHIRSVSVPNGSKALSDENINHILDNVDDEETIIIAADNDPAGMEMLNELASRIGKSRCKYLVYPKLSSDSKERCKDLNETLQLYGNEAVKETIARAKYVAIPGIGRMSDFTPVPTKEMFDIGITGMDKIKIRLGEWSVFTGIPGHGKTTFMTEWAVNMAQKYQWKTMFASFEHPPQEDHKENLQRTFLGKDPSYASKEDLERVDKWIDDNLLFCFPDYEQDVSIEWLFEIIDVAVKRHGAKLIIIDPWNMIDHENNESELRGTQYVAACLREFRRLAYRLNIHLCIVAHPTKIQKDKNDKYKIPSLYDVAESANWKNMCNLGFVIYRDEDDDSVILRVEKCKYGNKLGISNREDFVLKYLPAIGRYTEYG